jgi:hypothetical protein
LVITLALFAAQPVVRTRKGKKAIGKIESSLSPFQGSALLVGMWSSGQHEASRPLATFYCASGAD